MTVHFAAAAGRALEALTASPAPSVRSPVRPIAGAPITPAECQALREWADALPLEPAAKATAEQIARHVSFMAATLPAKNVDEDSGRMRAAVYCRLLAGHSNDALAFMARTACETLEWFPTPKQCLAILDQYRPGPSERSVALNQCHQFTQMLFEDWLGELRSGEIEQAEIDNKPDRWRRIAYEQDLLRRVPNGYVLRRPVITTTEAA